MNPTQPKNSYSNWSKEKLGVLCVSLAVRFVYCSGVLMPMEATKIKGVVFLTVDKMNPFVYC